jgi:purine-binding chemotaxis protein CheW
VSRETAPIDGTAARLRRTFDETFAAPTAIVGTASEDLLGIRIGGDPYAVRLTEIAGLHADRTIVPAPSLAPELLGVAALRGQFVAIYDLGLFLGYRPGNTPRWFMIARGSNTVGLAFEVLEMHARVPQTSHAVAGIESMREHLRGSVRIGDSFRPVIHIASVIEAIAKRAPSGTPANER